MNTFLLITN